MFGFGEKAKLEKLSQNLRERCLHEVVAEFAEERFTKEPDVKFLLEVSNLILEKVGLVEDVPLDEKIKKISTALSELGLPQEAADLYFARTKYEAIKTSAEVLYVMSKTSTTQEFVDFFYNSFIREVGLENLFFFIFPHRSGSRYEDFNISSEKRAALLSAFFNSLNSRKDFLTMVNHFAAMNPYFRSFPI